MAGLTGKGNILVVDDEPQIARVLKTTLSSHGYGTRTAADGDEALQVMKDWSPDLIITDLRIPNMDGLDLCRHVREKSQVLTVWNQKLAGTARIESTESTRYGRGERI